MLGGEPREESSQGQAEGEEVAERVGMVGAGNVEEADHSKVMSPMVRGTARVICGLSQWVWEL